MSKKHYLISLKVTPDLHMHCYLMCKERRLVQAVPAMLVDLAEERGFRPLPIVLMTTLSDSESIGTVRRIVSEDVGAKHNLENAKHYHCVVFLMSAAHDESLMELH